MTYKIQALNGFNMYFDQITSIFKTRYETDDNLNLDLLSSVSGLNRRKARIILNFLADLGLSQKRTLKKTRLGEIIYSYDEFFQKDGTLWLIHYLQSTNDYLIIWNRVMNHFFSADHITREELLALFDDLKDNLSEYTYGHHIGKEIRIILDAYTNQRLSKLNLMEEYNGTYEIHRNSDIPDLIFLSAVILYRDRIYPGATALNIEEICTSKNSPGRVFILDNYLVRKKLENLKNKGVINIESRGDLDQIRLREEINLESVLEAYYQE